MKCPHRQIYRDREQINEMMFGKWRMMGNSRGSFGGTEMF
jgi:hypothetical protein